MEKLEVIKEVISEISDVEPEEITMDTQLKDVLDSLAIVHFFVQVGKEFGTRIPKLETVSEVIQFLEEA